MLGEERRPTPAPSVPALARALLLFFHSPRSGPCIRCYGYLAQVLQRRRNHETFDLRRIDVDAHPDLRDRFAVRCLPTILVVEGKRVRARVEDPRGCEPITQALVPWLRRDDGA
jgi:thioredoxin-like negative regulator of GroEL